MRSSSSAATTLGFGLLVGCAGEAPPAASFAVADSVGVEVVTTSTPLWSDERAPWRLELELEIGQIEGDEPYLFGDPVGAVRLDDGRVAVADAQAGEIRFFDEHGVFVARAGRMGEGPGEFTSFRWLHRCGGRLVAYDWMQRRATPVSFSGEVGEPFAVQTPEAGRPPYRSRCLPDGSMIAVGWGTPPRMPEGQDYLFFAQTAPLWRLFPPGDSAITISEYISSERIMHLDRARGGGGSGPHPFARSVAFTGDDDRIFVGGAERLQIEVRSLAGELLRLFRGPDADLVIDEDFLESYRTAAMTAPDSAGRRWIDQAGWPMPDRAPAYTEVLIDPLGYLWVERFVVPGTSGRRWGVFGPDGVFMGHVPVPADLEVKEVGRDHVVGIARDELGVARVRVYRLERG